MSVELIVLVAVGAFLVLILLETPIFLSLVASGGLGIALLRTADQATSVIANMTYTPVASYSQSIVPMYILLGMFALHGYLSTRLFALASLALRWLPGGLGVATVAACAAFAAVSGSSVATAASIGKISFEAMRKFGYSASLATGIVSAAGTLGILIPPSVAMVLYGIVTQESIAQLLLAGVVPGIVLAILFAAYVVAVSILGKTRAPDRESTLVPAAVGDRARAVGGEIGGGETGGAEVSKNQPLDPPFSGDDPWDDVVTPFQMFRSVLWLGAIIAAVLAGMFTGVFTVIESAAVAALIALAMMLSENARAGARRTWSRLYESSIEAAAVTSMALSLFVGASVLSIFLVLTRTPMRLTEWVVGLDVAPAVVILAIVVIMLPLGMFLDAFSLIIIVAPLLYPTVVELGYSGVWFGVLFVILLEIALITPPVGMNVYVVASATKVPVTVAFRGAAPFVMICLLFAGLLIAVPELALWLPETFAVQE